MLAQLLNLASRMKIKFQISVLLIGIIVAIFCAFTISTKRTSNNHLRYLSYNFTKGDAYIFDKLTPSKPKITINKLQSSN